MYMYKLYVKENNFQNIRLMKSIYPQMCNINILLKKLTYMTRMFLIMFNFTIFDKLLIDEEGINEQ